LIGDIPIYVAMDSADVWAHPELFQLDKDLAPKAVAGVPPDFYSETGQLWGNPLYDWPRHEKTGFGWWRARMRTMATNFDVVRIDHFRGFYNYWSVPADAQTAAPGHWVMGPGMRFVEMLREQFPGLPIIAEDLGDLDDEVKGFFKEAGYPGMDVLIYAFTPDPWTENGYLPHNATANRVMYTSTHDAPSFIDWLASDATKAERDYAIRYLRLSDREGFNWGAVSAVWGSGAGLAMAPMQDVLGLGKDARMNKPATLGGINWQWRVRAEALNERVAARLYETTATYKRLPPKPPEPEPAEDAGMPADAVPNAIPDAIL